MRLLRSIVVVLLGMFAATDTVLAERRPHRHHRHIHSDVFLGFGVGSYWSPWHYGPPPAYYYPPPVVYTSPPVYVERTPSPPQPTSNDDYWYYCPAAERYYPYVAQCPGGWQQVRPTTPDASGQGR